MDSPRNTQLSPEEITAMLLENKRLREAEATRIARDAEEAAARVRRDQQKEDEQRALERQTSDQARLEKVGVTTPSKARGREKVKVQPAPRKLASHSGRVIRCSDDLSDHEKHHLLDDMVAIMDNRDKHAPLDPAAMVQVTDERRKEALAFLFEGGWNTTQPYANPPLKSQLNKTSDETGIAFGEFDEEGFTMENDWRGAGKTCYIHVNQGREKDQISFDYKDGKGSFISRHQVRLGEGWTINYAKKQACQNFDREHDRKVHAYNCCLFKSKGQRRLKEYAGKGDANRTKPEFNNALDAKGSQFGKTFTTLPVLGNHIRDLQELEDDLVRDGPYPKLTRFI